MQKLTSVEALRVALREGRTSCQEVVEQCLGNIRAHAHLNAFMRVYVKEAQQKAQQLDAQAAQEELAGVVVGIKDLLCYQDHPVQAGSKILEGFISQFSATAVQRLVDKGAIIIGHQSCDQFGMGSSNENSCAGPVRNPWDTARVPGGSSGGSAVGVATQMCHVALGTDTGGSVRQPAAFCGVVGLKPTYGRVSRHGLIAYASSFDTIGVFAQNVPDCAATLGVIAGADAMDSTVARCTVPDYVHKLGRVEKLKVAYFREAMESTGLQEEIRRATYRKLEALRKEGHQVETVDFPLLEYALPVYYVLTNAEASANLARLDGVRYGYRGTAGGTLSSMYTETRTEGFGEEVKRRILIGTYVFRKLCAQCGLLRRVVCQGSEGEKAYSRADGEAVCGV